MRSFGAAAATERCALCEVRLFSWGNLFAEFSAGTVTATGRVIAASRVIAAGGVIAAGRFQGEIVVPIGRGRAYARDQDENGYVALAIWQLEIVPVR